jgi:putative FmdB family regulatory protein
LPTYQYACTECVHTFEQVQSFTDDALTECPACGGRLRKIFNAVGVVFKGSGFYRNDSRAEAGSEGAGSDASASQSGGDNADASSAKPDGAAAKSDKSSAEPGQGPGQKPDKASKKSDSTPTASSSKPTGTGSKSPKKASSSSGS